MKSLRSLSPFRRRKTVADLLDDVRRVEESVAATTVLANETRSQRRAQTTEATPDTSRESGSTIGSSAKSKQRRSRSPFRQRKKVAELLEDVKQVETEYRSVALTRSFATKSGSRFIPAAAATPDSSATIRRSLFDRVDASPVNQRRCRSKSPFLRWKKADQLIEDVRRVEHLLDSSVSSSPQFMPGQSCRFTNSSFTTNSPAKGSPASRGRGSVSSNSVIQSRSRPPFQISETSNVTVDEINQLGIEYELDHFQPQGSHTIKSVGSERTEKRNYSRSRSPFLRRKKAEHLIEDIRKVEVDYASRTLSFCECSQVEVVLDVNAAVLAPASPVWKRESSYPLVNLSDQQTVATVPINEPLVALPEVRKPKSKLGRKSLLVQQIHKAGADEGKKATDRRSHIILSTASTDLHLVTTPDIVQRSNSFRGKISLGPRVSENAEAQSIIEKPVATDDAVTGKAEEPLTKKDQTMEPVKHFDLEVKKNDSNDPQSNGSNLVPPRSIDLGRRSRISELSCPLPDLQRPRSLGDDSVAEIQNALSKVQEELQGASKSGNKVSRVLVMKKLLEVADTIESQEDREMVRRKLSRMSVGIGLSFSDSSASSTSSYKRRLREVGRRLESSYDDDTSVSGSSSIRSKEEAETEARDSLSDESSFSHWLTRREQKKGQWNRILDMFGISNLWYDDGDLDKEWAEYADEHRCDAEDDIHPPPQIKKLTFPDYVANIPMQKAAPREISISQRKGEKEAARQTLVEEDSMRRQEIAEEEQMMRELEELDQKIRQEMEARRNESDGLVAERLKRSASKRRIENEEVDVGSRRATDIEQLITDDAGKAAEAECLRKLAEAQDRLEAAKLIKAKMMKQRIEDEKRRQLYIEAAILNAKGSGTSVPSIVRNANPDRSGPRHLQRPAITKAFSSDTDGSSCPSRTLKLASKKRSSWRRGYLSRKPLANAATVEAVPVARAPSSDVDEGALSLDSIESHQFSKGTTSVLQFRRRFEEEMGLEETSTHKMGHMKNHDALQANGKRIVYAMRTSDEERSDNGKAMRRRNSRPPRHKA